MDNDSGSQGSVPATARRGASAEPEVTPELTTTQAIVCDYGSLWTKATLFGRARRMRRLLATGTVSTPRDEAGNPDLRAATEAVSNKLRALTGLPEVSLLDGDGEDSGIALLAVGSAAPPLRLVLIAPTTPVARRAATLLSGAAYMEPIRAGSPADLLASLATAYTATARRRASDHSGSAARAWPDAVLLVEGRQGMTAADTRSLAQVFARTGVDTRLVPLLYCRPEGAGTTHDGRPAPALLDRLDTEVMAVDLTLREPHGLSALRRRINLLYSERSLGRGRGAVDLPLYRGTTLLNTAASQIISTRYAAGTVSGSVVSVDVGASGISVSYAFRDDAHYAVIGGHGLGSGAAALYSRVGEAAIRRWLPFEPRTDEIVEWAWNRTLAPYALSLTVRDTLIEQAFLREAVRIGIDELGLSDPPDLVIGSGGVARAGKPQLGIVTLLDALNVACPSWGRVDLLLDTSNVLSALGALATADPAMAAQVWALDGPRKVATAIAARGAKRDAPAISCKVKPREDGSMVADHSLTVEGGTLQLVHAPFGMAANVELVTSKGVVLAGTRQSSYSIDLQPSMAEPLPQLLLDTRPVAPPTGAQRAMTVAKYLIASGAYSSEELKAV